MLRIVCIIPARGGSKGIKNKNIQLILGKPLIAYSIKHSLNTISITNTYVSTDSEEIAEIAEKYSAKVIIRPDDISGDYSKVEEALKHSLTSINEEPDLVVFLQVTSPIRKKNDISNAIRKLIDEGADSLFSSRKIEGFIWKANSINLTPINYDFRNRPMRQDLDYQYKEENGSIYIFKPEILEKYNSRLESKITDYPMDLLSSVQIDYPNDIKLVENILRKHKDYYM